VYIPASFRCLELGLKKKYQEVERQPTKMKAHELIEWSEKYLGKQGISFGI